LRKNVTLASDDNKPVSSPELLLLVVFILCHRDMTSEGLGEMFEGDFANTFADKFPLVSMGG
jgi:hypothetical protein